MSKIKNEKKYRNGIQATFHKFSYDKQKGSNCRGVSVISFTIRIFGRVKKARVCIY